MDVCQAWGLTYWTTPILTVRKSVRVGQLGTLTFEDFSKICPEKFLSRKIQVSLKSDNNNRYFKNNIYVREFF